MNTHQQLRATLWCNVATGIAVIPNVVKKEVSSEWADHILKDFDERFPEPGPVDTDPEVVLLQKELETERMRLAAVGVVACADTLESAASARQMHPDYRSAALDDVERRVDECIALRAERDAFINNSSIDADVISGLRKDRDALRKERSILNAACGDLMRERDLYRDQLLAADISPIPPQ